MKIAIVHDELMRKGGAEQVTLCFHEAFPDAQIYTLAYHSEKTYPQFSNSKVVTSWFQHFAINENVMKWLFFPIGLLAMRSLNIKGYDVVLMSTTYCAKYANIEDKSTIICYCHQPFRLAWYPESYSIYSKAGVLKKTLFKIVTSLLRKIDLKYALRMDHFIANTQGTKEKISSCYKQPLSDIEVIKPAVDCSKFYVANAIQIKDYFLVVSRLEYYKKVDLVIDTFNELNIPLIVVGKGSKEAELKAMAKGNITFLSNIDSQRLATLMAECQALVFPQLEDYGITALEANASGRPTIAFGQGGVLDTMIPYKSSDDNHFTSIFFEEQNKDSLKGALALFYTLSPKLNPSFIREHAERFDKKEFIKAIKDYVSRTQKSR